MTKRWLVTEFIEEMAADVKRQVLFVEGNRDENFWKRVVPFYERISTTVYVIDNMEIPEDFDGQKGRMIWLANYLVGHPVADRIKFFVDADFDHLIKVNHPNSVILTDFKDLEGYALAPTIVHDLCHHHLRLTKADHETLVSNIEEVGRPYGVLRLLSKRDGLDLPFRQSFQRDNGKRFASRISGDKLSADIMKMVTSLCNAKHMTADKVRSLFENVLMEIDRMSKIDIRDVVHGKDYIALLSWYIKSSTTVAESLVFSSIFANLEQTRTNPRFALVERWIRS